MLNKVKRINRVIGEMPCAGRGICYRVLSGSECFRKARNRLETYPALH